MRRVVNLRTIALLGLALLLVASACDRNNDDEDVAVTEAPSPTPGLRYAADFQLVGTIDEAFAGQSPDVEIPTGDFGDPATTASPGGSPGASPVGTPVGANPPRGGILRITLEAVNADLTDACGIEGNDLIEVFWTTDTFFEPEDVIDDIEDDIEDRVAGIAGRIYTEGEGALDLATPTLTPSATGSPAASPTPLASPTGTPSTTVEDTDCILVAEQVGFTRPTAPTPRPFTRTQAPAPRTPTPAPPTPTPTAAPTDSPEPTGGTGP